MSRLIAFVLLVIGLTPKSATPAPDDLDTQGQARTSFDQHADEALAILADPPGLAPEGDFEMWERESGWRR